MKIPNFHSQSNPENPDFDLSKSLKVKSKVTIWEIIYGFLSVDNTIMVDISYSFEDMSTLKLKNSAEKHVLRHNVTEWRHNVIKMVPLKSTHQDL